VKIQKKHIQIGFILVLLIFLGFLRETIFKNTNALLQAWDADFDYSMPVYLEFIKAYEYDTIVNLKWLFTLLFSLLYLGISCYAIKVIFNQKIFLKITLAAYLTLIIISGLFILTGLVLLPFSDKMYEFARYFMGIAQSPLVLMILIPVFKISQKEKTSPTL
jgi:hypothetical protein